MSFQLQHITVELITSLEDDAPVETWVVSDGRFLEGVFGSGQ